MEARTELENSLADVGFAFANVNAIPDIKKKEKTVSFNFVVDPGPKVYVRRINIRGNTSTRDDVVRREMRQLEGSEYSAADIRRSKERIKRLGFFDDVSIDIPAVPGTVDQVDVNVTISERATGSFLFGVGYSGSDGLILQAEVNRENLFGSGRQVKFKIDYSVMN
jgi:outer membrane protein insertion porin family